MCPNSKNDITIQLYSALCLANLTAVLYKR